ncbi:hypothetical protein A9Q84_12190 [Halobacteriovorax marinus]|uniref:Fatty acid desaturase domain-containing protein n=1 Tax=Halobacteriovorax marinus TaxID=97084 RepID=A0A1Y5F8G8_9BACT|nr:hypothetical protein A9Q84_12190 [Halobacteriovorax marinus]
MTALKYRSTNTAFRKRLHQEVDHYFNSTNVPRTGDSALKLQAILIMSWWLGSYTLLNANINYATNTVSFTSFIIASLSLIAGVGHGALHGTFGSNSVIGEVSKYIGTLLGFSSQWWIFKHNKAHHTYTQVYGSDSDITQGSLARLSSYQPMQKHFKYQHIYIWFIYPLLHLYMISAADLELFFNSSINGVKSKRSSLKVKSWWLVQKVMALTFLIIIPSLTFGIINTLIGFLIGSLIFSLILSISLQTNHCVGKPVEAKVDHENKLILEDWAVNQLKNGVVVSEKNKALTFILGGLNLHSAHHLFPNISQTHYANLTKIIDKIANEMHIPQKKYPSMLSAVKGHVEFLKYYGEEVA